MSDIASLKPLRDATINKIPIILVKSHDNQQETTDNIKEATHVKFGEDGTLYLLETQTNFYNEEKPQSLRAVIFCWLHEKSSIVDYKNECIEYGISDFKFLVKTELTTWLIGNSETCAFVKGEASKAESTEVSKTSPSSARKRKLDDPQIERISKHERESIDHNAMLRGSKNIDFSFLISDAKKFISQLKRSKPSSKGSAKNNAPKKSPIIIISPATTSLITLNNVKEFLEEGRFTEPNVSSTSKPENGVVTIHHKSERLIPAASQITVVDNVDMFTKPEYWDRVVAIFTTGQVWQFAKYKYSKPEILFQRYSGFYVSYEGDVTPKQIKDWNVTELKIGRGEKRFKDKMIVRDFWASIEKVLISKGYGNTSY
ncbi:Piso0_000189 [Millerozyma farinosa CBS 7064]|uniref:Piso0_000189 protein n=1 Tax=Pichia sorbitophila (strain ATCC MYA-4447 / BCRC 22081 / CBS 7064 / NBRC 10061 / NRRL Y-12695) TaxID=559304 RepID=G8YTB5_PICSO|nr:Piso0_000189 [Millerozyma farinosa CBS 7064]